MSEITPQPKQAPIPLPKKSFSVEFFVGLFAIASVLCVGYLAMGLGELRMGPSSTYDVFAEFDNVAGLKTGASVEIAGVQIGSVADIALKDPMAKVTLRISNTIKLRDDDIVLIRTKGIIGDRYVKISRGASDSYIAPGSTMAETESVVDFEEIIGKFIHSFEGKKDTDNEDV